MPARNGSWNGSGWIRKDKRLAIYMRDNWHCCYCNKDLSRVRPKLRTLDHLIAVASGGTNDETNLVTCCSRCNERKQNRDWVSFVRTDAKRGYILRQVAKPLNRQLAKQILAGIIDRYAYNAEEVK